MGLANNDIVLLSLRGSCFGQRIILTHTLQMIGAAPAGTTVADDLDTIAAEWAAAGAINIVTPYLACLPPQYTLEEIRTQRIRPVRSAYRSLIPVGAVGTNVNNATVACDSGAITLRGPDAGRHQHGTKHIGPLPDGASVAGVLTAAQQALHSALAAKLVLAANPVGWGATLVGPVLVDKATGNTVNVQTFRIGTTSRVQNRRVVGRGE